MTTSTVFLRAGEVTAIAGGSGAGKTTLLEALAGRCAGDAMGFVPQDDIIHRELPVARTLQYAARLRMPAGTSAAAVDAAVTRVIGALGLTGHERQPVATLSGGERKRVSIAVELLTRPEVLFLDEPTSGLDPATGAELLATAKQLAADGTAVALTTHTPADLLRADRVLFLGQGGEVVYDGPPQELCAAFGAPTVEEVYGRVASGVHPALAGAAAPSGPGAAAWPPPPGVGGPGETRPADGGTASGGGGDAAPDAATSPQAGVRRLGAVRQWALLTRRNADILRRDRLSLAVLGGSPVMIVAMFAVLFKPGAFDPAAPMPSSSAMILFWIAFGAFFFGLAYGLLQICAELPVVRRERRTVLRLGPYVLAKLTVLLPVLAAADVLLLTVLRALDRLPDAGWDVYGPLFATTLLASAAALALGLLASACVSQPAQATLLLPLLCFPQVLFSGAFVPVPQMALPGRVLSYAMTNRWAYEALGSGAGLESLWTNGHSPLGPPLLASYGDSFSHPVILSNALLAGFTLLFLAATWIVLARRCRRSAERKGLGTY
ncbi:ATP-binding cassette domain-containing protein [Streptomyces sp. NPDC051907]|uniref:ATP-binding cassette domain-containing protein n=1 Tax=Streptomyces sp. NPDC051907 TaxID=3155284 RepID=UPI003431F61E